MSVLDSIKEKAKANIKHILLPEGPEERTVQAARKIVDEGLAKVTLIGDPDKIAEVAKKFNVSLEGVGVLDHLHDVDFNNYANQFYEMRKTKGVTLEKAEEQMKNTLFYACMMIKNGRGDGMVSGAINTTGNTLRPGLQIIKMAPGVKTISSCFIMEVPNCAYGDDGVLLFGDCAININPTSEELASIAIATAGTAKGLLGMDPRVAMLSFSTKGSAKHEYVDKVTEALAMVHEKAPELKVDGELQADAALVKKVGDLKAPGSPIAGKANILIFPDIQAGNIGYKLVQRFANASAVGPVSQGFAKPINDLSRGCNVEDIVSLVAITSVQAAAIE